MALRPVAASVVAVGASCVVVTATVAVGVEVSPLVLLVAVTLNS